MLTVFQNKTIKYRLKNITKITKNVYILITNTGVKIFKSYARQ